MSDINKTEEQSVSDATHEEVVTLQYKADNCLHEFKILLNRDLYSQKTMWNDFSNGYLYEQETSQVYIDLLQPGDTFIDIGAHIGYFSLLAASLIGQDGLVMCFEPNESNLDQLKKNVIINQFTNIQVMPFAVGNENKKVDFFLNQDNDGGHALWDVGKHDFNIKSREHSELFTVQMKTLDSILSDNRLDNLKLIKMDVEGCESMVIDGAMNTLKLHNYPFVISEINRFALSEMESSEDELRKKMQGLGYDCYVLTEAGLILQAPGKYIECDYVFNVLFAHSHRINETSLNIS